MRLTLAALFLTTLALPAVAQRSPMFTNDGMRVDVSAGFNHVQANAPPGICQCFGVNGGYASLDYFVTKHLAVEGEFTGGTSSNISALGQDLTLFTYMGGGKYTFVSNRFEPFAQILVGEARASNSYFPTATSYTTSASSFALAPGGGLDIDLSPHFTLRAVQANFLRTTFANGTTNSQNQLMIGAGLVVKFGKRSLAHPKVLPAPAAPPAAPVPAPVVTAFSLDCSTDASSALQGQAIAVTGRTYSSDSDASFSWVTSGGQLLGTGSRVSLDTSGLPPGNYTVTGHAVRTADNSVAECNVTVAVLAPPPAAPVPPPAPAPEVVTDEEFHANVHDVFFAVDKSILRPEALDTIRRNADYLVAHASLHVLIGGYADTRGSVSYNLALGERRATAVRNQLIADGVPADHIQLVTFGRNTQICTAGNEECYQQNRRVGFLLHP